MDAYLLNDKRVGDTILKSGTKVNVLNPKSPGNSASVEMKINDVMRTVLVPKKDLLLDIGDLSWVFALNSEF